MIIVFNKLAFIAYLLIMKYCNLAKTIKSEELALY